MVLVSNHSQNSTQLPDAGLRAISMAYTPSYADAVAALRFGFYVTHIHTTGARAHIRVFRIFVSFRA